MKYEINNEVYDVVIEKKNNKNLYIRVKEDLTILVTTNYLTSKKQILDVLDQNQSYILKMIEKRKKDIEKDKYILYLGNKYDLVFGNLFDEVEIAGNKIYAHDQKQFDKWYKKQMQNIFDEHYQMLYNKFEEQIPFYRMRIREMKTRWGVCNVKSKTITLNSRLIEYPLEALDYVIVHELSHLIYFNHSSSFWNLVAKYKPDYKRIRKELKE